MPPRPVQLSHCRLPAEYEAFALPEGEWESHDPAKRINGEQTGSKIWFNLNDGNVAMVYWRSTAVTMVHKQTLDENQLLATKIAVEIAAFHLARRLQVRRVKIL